MAFQNSSSLTNRTQNINCAYSKAGLYLVPTYIMVWSCLLFPLYFLVLHTGVQRWRKNKRSAVSHTDFFTYNMSFFELFYFIGYVFFSVTSVRSDYLLSMWAIDMINFAFPGLLFLHILTCVERYLAVLHPVFYLSLRNRVWIWARNLIILEICAFCLVWASVLHVLKPQNTFTLQMILLGVVASIIIFCSSQVLRALRNPGPGEGRGVSQAKRKAFCTMVIILTVLLVWLEAGVASMVAEKAKWFEPEVLCIFQKSIVWFELPGSLVSPLLFLHRAGKLPKCRGKKVVKADLA